MLVHKRALAGLLLVLAIAGGASAQDQRPIPYPVTPTDAYQRAIDLGTRTATGEPGPQYWMNRAEYIIEAALTPSTNLLEASGTIRYHNESPYELPAVVLHLYQNLHQKGAMRNRPSQVTGGMQVFDLTVNGEPLEKSSAGPGYVVRGTHLVVRPSVPLGSGETVEIGIAWQFEVPRVGAPRMGQDGEVYYLGYWYPQVAVFDDVRGWVADPYLGEGEFYMGFADYQVDITVPEGWLMAATGELLNPEEVYSEQTRERLASVDGGEIRTIVGEADRGVGRATARAADGRLTWRFRAENVRDFAFGTSERYVWDAGLATPGDGSAPYVHALYRPEKAVWKDAAEYTRFSIERMSELFMPYPWPHMTVVEGIIGGGMEYPMITVIGGNRNERSLFGTTLHEVVHMWFPMIVNQDEKSFTWMDEGLTSFLSADGTSEYWNDPDVFASNRQQYYLMAGADEEIETMRHADSYPVGSSARNIAHYSKPAVAFNALRGIVGEDRFMNALQEYADRWAYRHPYPWDLFNTFNDVVGEDLGWFWRTMFYETWEHDLALADVDPSGDAVTVVVEDLGRAPMPAWVRVTYADGMTVDQEIPVSVWLEGERQVDLQFQGGDVAMVEIDPDEYLPDVDRSNNIWQSGSDPLIGG